MLTQRDDPAGEIRREPSLRDPIIEHVEVLEGPRAVGQLSRTARLVERRDKLDKLIQAGRLTEEDAERLTAAAKSGELNDAARKMQLRHARARVNAAVEDGRLTQEDAQAIFDRLENGEDPRFLRRGIPADR